MATSVELFGALDQNGAYVLRATSDGALVMAKREFVEAAIYKENRKRFGPKRKTGARRMRGVEVEEGPPELCVMRDLRVGVFG